MKDSISIKVPRLKGEFAHLNSEITDLKRQLKIMRSKPPSGKTGRTRVDLLNELGYELYRSDPSLTEAYATEAIVLSERIGYRKGEANSNRLIGIAYAATGKYFESMEHFNIAREIFIELDDKKGLAGILTNIGVVYSNQSRLDLAFDHHMKALNFYEKVNDKHRLAHSLNCIGVVFRKRNNLEKAEYYYERALRIREDIGDMYGLAFSYNNMGILEKERGNLKNALDFYEKSLKIKEELNDKKGKAIAFSNIGDIHMELKRYTLSLEYYKKALSIDKDISDENNLSDNYNKIGHIMTLLGKHEQALEYFEQGLKISSKIGARICKSNSLRELSDLYKAMNNYEKAFIYFKEYSILQQEIFSEKSAETITRLQVRYETEQKEKEAELYYLKNVELQKEINDRKLVESQLVVHEHLLEKRVKERTIELQQSMQKLKKSVEGTIHTLSKIIESKDPYTAGHQLGVAELARKIAIEMGFTEDKVEAIYMISLVHDIGKISIPQEILSRPGELSELEWEIVQTHPQIGYDILCNVEFPWPVADVILQHQELYDGSGYPNGLKGNEIMIEARIISVADVIEAMTSHRPYRSMPGLDNAIKEITLNSGILYDPEVVESCMKIISEKNFSSSRINKL